MAENNLCWIARVVRQQNAFANRLSAAVYRVTALALRGRTSERAGVDRSSLPRAVSRSAFNSRSAMIQKCKS